MRKATQSTFQAYLCVASLNDLRGSSVPERVILAAASLLAWPVKSCHILGSVAKGSKVQWRGRGWEGVSNCSDSQMPAYTPGAKTLSSFLSLPESPTTPLLLNMAPGSTLRFIELEQHSSSAPWNRLSNSPVTPGLQAPHPITSWLLDWLNVL